MASASSQLPASQGNVSATVEKFQSQTQQATETLTSTLSTLPEHENENDDSSTFGIRVTSTVGSRASSHSEPEHFHHAYQTTETIVEVTSSQEHEDPLVQPNVLSQVILQGAGESSSSEQYAWENCTAMNTELPTSPGASSSSTLTAAKEGDSKPAAMALSTPIPGLGATEFERLKHETEKREAKEREEFIARFEIAQPTGRLLSSNDPLFEKLVRDFRAEKDASDAEAKRRRELGLDVEVKKMGKREKLLSLWKKIKSLEFSS